MIPEESDGSIWSKACRSPSGSCAFGLILANYTYRMDWTNLPRLVLLLSNYGMTLKSLGFGTDHRGLTCLVL